MFYKSKYWHKDTNFFFFSWSSCEAVDFQYFSANSDCIKMDSFPCKLELNCRETDLKWFNSYEDVYSILRGFILKNCPIATIFNKALNNGMKEC